MYMCASHESIITDRKEASKKHMVDLSGCVSALWSRRWRRSRVDGSPAGRAELAERRAPGAVRRRLCSVTAVESL